MGMDIYTIKHGIMRQVPVDFELKQAIKFILVFIIGLMIGNYWAQLAG